MSAVDYQTLRSLLDYDPKSGEFRWLRTKGRANAGDVAGASAAIGYVLIRINGRLYYAHRLAWLWINGSWPSQELDHLDGDKGNNRIENLRLAGRSVNMQNRRAAQRNNKSTGLLGAYRRGNKFRSAIQINGRQVSLGAFDSAEEAHAAYIAAKRKFHEGCTL